MAATEAQKIRQRRANLKPARKKYSRDWQARPENKRKASNIRYRYKYGITLDEKEAMLAQQGGCCAACGGDQPGHVRGWNVDHCHTTSVVRGVLCYPCNIALGLLKDNPVRMRRLAAYIEVGGRFRCQI